jgi:hypothetical protein
MHSRNVFAALALFAISVSVRPAMAQDKAAVLAKLDAAAKNFHSATASVDFDSKMTDPIPDDDVMTGTAYYERDGSHFQMAAHLSGHVVNNKTVPIDKIYIFSGGTLRYSDTGKDKDAQPYNQANQYEGYLMLGFGASGQDLEAKWDITYEGKETLNGIATDKLKLVAKDPKVLKLFPSVTIWLDTSRAVSLKQVFDQGAGQSRVCSYTDIKVNQPLPKNSFSFDK